MAPHSLAPSSTSSHELGGGTYDPVSPAEDDDGGSLFGDGGSDGGSLFGEITADEGSLFGDGPGDDVSSSPFMEEKNDYRPKITLPTPESQLEFSNDSGEGTRASSSDLLSLPTIPDPPDAFFSHQDGHTSGLHVVSTHHLTEAPFTMSREEELELEAMMESDLLKESAVNTDTSHDSRDQEGYGTTSTDPLPSEDGFDQDLALTEFKLLRNQALRSTAGFESYTASQAGLGLGLDALTGFRFSGAATRRGVRLPRRIDLEEQHVQILAPYLTLSRRTKNTEHFDRLELCNASGKALIKHMKAYLARPESYWLISRGPEANPIQVKDALLKSAFHLLRTEDWGTKYFGRHHPSGQNRKLYWPDDSTLITYHFVLFLSKIIDSEKLRLKSKKKATQPQELPTGGSRQCPIDLSTDGIPLSAPQGVQPYASHCFRSSEPLSHPPLCCPMVFGSQNCASSPTSTWTDDTSTSITPDISCHGSSPDCRDHKLWQEDPATSATFDMLAEEISRIKRRKRTSATVPADADLKYRLSFRDEDDSEELRPAVTYRHSNKVILSGAFLYLQKSFATVATRAIIMINTPKGQERINSQEEWDAAVLSVWQAKGTGGLVEVDVVV